MCWQKLNLNGDSVLMESCRSLVNGSFKFSYHLVYQKKIFPCNSGRMKVLATQIKDVIKKKVGINVMDNCVYTRNRAFRAPLCFKLSDSSRTPLSFTGAEKSNIHKNFMKAMVTNVPNECELVPDVFMPSTPKKEKKHNSTPKKHDYTSLALMYSEKKINLIE